jgi:hypothetical protein
LWHAAKHDSLVRRPQHFAPDISMPMVKPPFGSKKIAADFFFSHTVKLQVQCFLEWFAPDIEKNTDLPTCLSIIERFLFHLVTPYVNYPLQTSFWTFFPLFKTNSNGFSTPFLKINQYISISELTQFEALFVHLIT